MEHGERFNGISHLIGAGLALVFYVRDRKLRHGHGIWHLFVMGGSTCHFLTVLLHVA